MDLLDFQAEQLYFDEPIDAGARQAIDSAAEHYGEDEAEQDLLRAYFLEPEHPLVLVALYRYFYYQHRLAEAIRVADRVIRVFAKRLNLPEDWRLLNKSSFENGVMVSMTTMRFYMLALKGAGYLDLRMGQYESAMAKLEKVAELDENDRLGAKALLTIARESLNQQTTMQAAGA